MADIKSSGHLLASIAADLSDNNAGLISAEDVRHNMADTARSINQIVASGDTDGDWPFVFDVKAKVDNVAGVGGTFIAESGVKFPNSPINSSKRQVEPFLGVGGLSHDSLADLSTGDKHTQYLNIDGNRAMIGNLALSTYWVGSEGTDNGLKFTPTASGDDITVSGTFEFQKDQSRMDSAHGVAKAWMNWSAVGGQVVVNSYHNIDSINASHNSGVFQITFTSGTFLNNNYTAIGISNGISSTGTYDAMQPNSVGITLREGDDGTSLRSLYFKVEQDDGDAVFAGHNDLVVYGYNPGSTSGVGPTVTNYSP